MKTTTLLGALAAGFLFASCSGGGGGGGGGGGTALSDLSYPMPSVVYLVGVPIKPNTPSVQGTTPSWSIAPALPAGLAISATNGRISGTPTEASPVQDYVVTASNPKGSLTIDLRLGVERPAHFLLVRDGADGSVSAFTTDAATGDLAPNGYATIADTGTKVHDLAVREPHAWALVGDPGEIVPITVDPATGLITPGASTAAGDEPRRLIVRADGKFAYVLDVGAGEILVYSVDAATGALTAQGALTVTTAAGPVDFAIDSDGARAFVAGSGANTVTCYAIDATNGGLTQKSESVMADVPAAIAVAPDGSTLCVLMAAVEKVQFIAVEASNSTLALGNTRSTGSDPTSVAFHPSGRAVYVTLAGADSMALYPVETDGTLGAEAGRFPTSNGPQRVGFDPSGLYALVACNVSNVVDRFTVDQVDMEPTLAGSVGGRGFPLGFDNVQGDVPLVKDSPFLYTLNALGDSLSAFTIEDGNGALSSAGVDVLIGDEPTALAVDPFGRFLFAASRLTHQVFVFAIDEATGTLGTPETLTLPNGLKQPVALVVDPSGQFLFIASDMLINNDDVNFLICFSVNQSTGALENLLSTAALGNADPISMSMDPAGRFLYVSTVHDFRVYDPEGGVIGTTTPTNNPNLPIRNYVFDPTGKRVWMTVPAAKSIDCYDVDSVTGALTFASSTVRPRRTLGLTALPGTPYLYSTLVESGSTGFVEAYTAAETDGALTPFHFASHGLDPTSIASDASGHYLYVVNEAGNDIDVFEVDRTGGTFTLSGTTVTGTGPIDVVLTTRLN